MREFALAILYMFWGLLLGGMTPIPQEPSFQEKFCLEVVKQGIRKTCWFN